MTLIPSFTRSSARVSPIWTLRSSDSTTQGPAMRNGPFSAPKRCDMSVRELSQRARGLCARMEIVAVQGRSHEARKQWMRAHRPRLQLGMELATDEPGMVGQLDHFDERSIRREARAAHSVLREHIAIGVRHLVAVPVTLAHLRGVVRLRNT